ncbi:MAG: TetR/AcrR family transcriptional regulator [Streptosporangiaceae bacterium]
MTTGGGQIPARQPSGPHDVAGRRRPGAPAKPSGEPMPPPRAPARPKPPSLGGGEPAQGRALGRQGQRTVRKLLEAALVEFDERGFQAVRVDDVVRRANTSHGTFYLYFSNKDDLFRTLLRDALDDMQVITDEFPVVTRNESGKAALRHWVHRFCEVYAAHATIIRILSQADPVEEQVYGDGLRMLFRLAEAITQGMTAGASGGRPNDRSAAHSEHAELTAVACLMMLERVNYLLSAEVRLPREEMEDRVSAIMYAAFHLA